jgi:hypothetical protein
VWFLALAHSSLTGGHLSFLTTRIDYPQGINVLDNASMGLLGALLAPVTALVGPVGSFSLLLRLSFVLSATSAFAVLRRLVRRDLAAAAGGALYGFSPYMTHQGATHVFLAFVPLPPIMLLLVFEGLSVRPRPRRLTRGLLLGLLAAAQYFICSEILISTALIAVLGAAVLGALACLAGAAIGPQLRAVSRLAGGAALVAVPLLAYPAWFALAGPRHIRGPTQLVTSPGDSVLSTVLPTDHRVLAGLWFGWRVVPIPLLADNAYLGIPLLLVVAVVAVVGRHSPLVRASVVVGIVAWILSLGPRFVWRAHSSTIPLPFALLTHVPVAQDLVPSRLSLYVDLAAAALLAVGVDRLCAHLRRPRARSLPGLATTAVGFAATVAGLAFALPSKSYPVAGVGPAPAFAGGALGRAIPADAVVLAYPYPVFPEDDAMLWQAEDRLRFSLLGGYAVRPAGGGASKAPPLLQPEAVQGLLLGAWPDPQLTGTTRTSVAAAAAALPTFVRRHRVSAVVVERAGRNPGEVIDLFTRVYGPPRRFGPIDLWTGLAPTAAPAPPAPTASTAATAPPASTAPTASAG